MVGDPKRGFLDQPPSAQSTRRGSDVQQKVKQSSSSVDSSGSLPPYNSSHQATSLNPAADYRARIGREDPSRQKGGPSVTACPYSDERSAPHRQGSQDSTFPRSGSDLRDYERPEVKRNCQPSLMDRSPPGGAKEPVSEAGDKQHSTHSWSLMKFFAPFTSSGIPPPKQVRQGKTEATSSLIPETNNILSKTNSLEPELKALRSSSHPQSSQFLQALERPIQIVNYLLGENQRLQKELQELKNTQETRLADLQAENHELQQELEKLRKRLVPESKTTAEEMPVPKSIAVQVQRSGNTGGCEKQFLHDVAKLLSSHKISLQVEEYREGSKHLLLLFCPITSRPGPDIDNALDRLKSMQKTLLVVFHYKSKSSTKFFADMEPQVRHPALVGTVHACFSIQDGFYHSQINQDAVESVAATIMRLTQDG